jgi:hypothetical protein
MKPRRKTELSINKINWIIVISMVVLLVLPLIACGKVTPIPTNPEEILNQAANVTQVRYDCYTERIDSSGNSQEWLAANVMVKGTKMRVGFTTLDEEREEYLVDFDANTMYVWYPPENKPAEMKNAWEIPEMTSALIWAKTIQSTAPQIIGTETIDNKECLVIEFNFGQDNPSNKAWVWIKHPFLIQMELLFDSDKLLLKFKNIDFGDISDSTFELPGPVSPTDSGTTLLPATTPVPPFPDILSSDDSIELVSINPVSGTILKKGTSVPFTVTVKYELKSVDQGFIRALLGIESGTSIGIGSGFEVQKGSGTTVIEGSVDIDFLIKGMKSDKVNLRLSLIYQISSHEERFLVSRFFKDCFFIVDSYPNDEQNGAGISPSAPTPLFPVTDAFMKGICFSDWAWNIMPRPPQFGPLYYPPQADVSLRDLATTGANWISLLVNGVQETFASTKITRDQYVTASDEALRHVIDYAHSLGMRVILQPALFSLPNTPGISWIEIGTAFTSETQWQEWFDSYREFINHYASFAQEAGVDMLYVGSELYGTTHREDDWRRVIKEVRERFKGPISYDSVFWGFPIPEFQRITWWDAVDYIAVDCWHSLTDKNDPTVAELKEGLIKTGYVDDLDSLSRQFNKSVIISEIGYDSLDGTNIDYFGTHNKGEPVDLQEQADCYQAVLEVLWGKPWLKGIFWWQWSATSAPWLESPQGKPAEEVLTNFYLNDE